MTDGLKAELAQRVAAGRTLVVVGTGVSLAATDGSPLASWRGLIGNGIDRCVELGSDGADAGWAGVHHQLLSRPSLNDLLGVAEQVSRRLGWRDVEPCGGDWNEWLRRTIGSLRPQKPELIEAIRDLGAPLATLNYDNLLSDATGLPPLTWKQAERWLPVLEGEDEAVLHLHGHWRQPNSVVLGIRSYDAALGAGLAQHLQRTFATTRSLVFVGCGGTFSDPNFGALLDWMRGHLSGAEHRHYLLVREGEAPPVAEEALRAARIYQVSYGAEHADLLPFVRALAPKRASAPPSGGSAPGDNSGSRATGVPAHNLTFANPDFVGREAVLDDLRRLLTSGAGPAVLTQTITGLGGIGKTQTALAYAHRHLADYRLVWWLRAETAATLAADYATLAEPLGLDSSTADQGRLIAAVRTELQARDGWLLVLDNVEEPTLPRTYLPSTGHGHVLMTSRRTDWRGVARTLPLEVMSEGEALRLLTGLENPEALPPAELAEAEALARELGRLPLALAQARAYMDETGRDLAGYLRLFRASRPEVLRRRPSNPDYLPSVATTWQISVDAAAGECAAALSLLELLAFFAPDALPTAVLASEPGALPQGLRDEFARDEAVAALNRFSLVRAEAGSITVHRLIQAVTRDGLDGATAETRAETAVRLVNAALPRPPQEHTNWPAIGTLLPHALATAGAAERLGVGLDATARTLNATALYHYARAAWAEAEPLFERAVAIGEEALGPGDPNLALMLNNLANLYSTARRYDEAEPLYQRALAITEETLGPEHPTLAIRLNNLAALYRDTGRHAEAEPLFKRALAIDGKTPGPEHPTLAIHLWSLAAQYQVSGRPAEAEPLYQRALMIFEESLPADHPYTAAIREQYARFLDQLGRGERTTKPSVQVKQAGPTIGGDNPSRRSKVGRNDPCPCGSGRKYKRCHGAS